MSGFARNDVHVPEAIRLLSGQDVIAPVWQNGGGGITFQIGVGAERRFAKCTQASP